MLDAAKMQDPVVGPHSFEEIDSGIYPASSMQATSPKPPVVADDLDIPVQPRSMAGVIGCAESLVDVYRVVDRVADTTCTILITGESGTGKELVARAVHDASPRASKPFVAVNCGAIPEALLESELFGHARGAFTGAHANKIGRIAQAQGGTLFLDEIGELPLALQVKLLRVLQSKEFSPVGDTRTLDAEVRIVAATNINLDEAVRDGRFREDLYYRLNVIHVHVPPMRERQEDVPLLVHHFLKRANEKTGRQISQIGRSAAQLLADYSWPGNVRELENTIERAVLLCNTDTIEPKDLPSRVCGLGQERRVSPRLPEVGLDLRTTVESFENHLIRQALERTSWNKKQAAELLGLNRTTLVEMLKRKRIAPKAA
ncbi:MAG TPA: sigma 54-interacting transcriptional regulator [Polyangiaceae bacterium]|mgnify:CR=1 FL=1|nr:sigma 54-interacting transcriptional regulator [Polyangiaceae bacterium]